MSHAYPAILEDALNATLGILAAGIVLSLVRLARGPSLADRVVAFDLLTFLVAGVAAAAAIRTDEPAFLDAAIVVTLVPFLATVAFAQFLMRRGRGGNL